MLAASGASHLRVYQPGKASARARITRLPIAAHLGPGVAPGALSASLEVVGARGVYQNLVSARGIAEKRRDVPRLEGMAPAATTAAAAAADLAPPAGLPAYSPIGTGAIMAEAKARMAESPGESDVFVLGIMGDLHLEPGQMSLFHEGQHQMTATLARLTSALTRAGSATSVSTSDGDIGTGDSVAGIRAGIQGPSSQLPGAAPKPQGEPAEEGGDGEAAGAPCRTVVVQLGDVGGYNNAPGSAACFRSAVEFLDSFGFPRRSVTGNHDLEGAEFDTDEENLAAWQAAFGQIHFWVQHLGSAVCIGLSSVQFRSAEDSCHEVYVDDAQFMWFEERLEEYKDLPVFVFSHAPPMGSGLTSLQEVHVRNRCAWLNHSHNPQKFLDIVHRHPNIKLWFSGHFHLSHDYEGSVSRVANTLFVQTGVMGGCHRDGRRHSRVLMGDKSGYRLMTLDHGAGELRTDIVHQYSSEALGFAPQRLWCSTLSFLRSSPGGGVFSPVLPADITSRDKDQFPPTAREAERTKDYDEVEWLLHGSTLLAIHANQIVQYDVATRAPIGVVCDGVNGRSVNLVLGPIQDLEGGSAVAESGALPPEEAAATAATGVATDDTHEVVAIELQPTARTDAIVRSSKRIKGETGFERIERNAAGGFWRIYQVNKWRLKKQKAAEEAAAAAAARMEGGLPLP